jgi:CO/xanthine dehydrogenase Mo-binding subunit
MPLGILGLGEVGMTGVAAAIANAVFHATGKRVRELPITLDKLVAGNRDVGAGQGDAEAIVRLRN